MQESSKLIASLLNTIPSDDRLYLTLIRGVWARAVGDQLAERSQPWSYQDGLLRVAVPSEEWKNNLSLIAENLLQRLKARLGDGRLIRMDFFVNRDLFSLIEASAPAPDSSGPCPADEPVTDSDCIYDPELQELFRRTAARHLALRGHTSKSEK